jgi:hypothetical protein
MAAAVTAHAAVIGGKVSMGVMECRDLLFQGYTALMRGKLFES